jgi:hypothetical protein
MTRGTRTLLIAVPLVLVIVAGAAFGYRAWHDHAPYQPAALGAHATIEVVAPAQLEGEMAKLGGQGLTPWYGQPGDQLFVGQVSYRVPAAAKGAGQYDILVIDKANQQVAPVISGVAATPGATRSGWQSTLDKAASTYDWLAAAAGARPGAMIFMPADTAGPVTFQGGFASTVGDVTAADLLVALVFVGPDGQIYWAQRLAG